MKPSEWEMRERVEGWTNNEEEWLACPVAHSLLNRVLTITDLQLGRNERKLRLFGAACCRLVWPHLNSESRLAIEAAEQYADGEISEQQLYEAKQPLATWVRQTTQPGRNDRHRRTEYAQYCFAVSALEISSAKDEGGWPYIERIAEMAALQRSTYEKLDLNEDTVEAALCERLRDIYGNPFRGMKIDSAWPTPTVLELAQSIYVDRKFEELPRLANALEGSGCNHIELLKHCREKQQTGSSRRSTSWRSISATSVTCHKSWHHKSKHWIPKHTDRPNGESDSSVPRNSTNCACGVPMIDSSTTRARIRTTEYESTRLHSESYSCRVVV